MLLLEDDTGFKDGFDRLLESALNELPEDWDALWLGGTSLKVQPYSACLKRLIAGTGGYGILFRDTVYDALVASLGKEDLQADVSYMKNIQPKFNCFRTAGNLVLHKAGHSTIQNRFVDYPELRR